MKIQNLVSFLFFLLRQYFVTKITAVSIIPPLRDVNKTDKHHSFFFSFKAIKVIAPSHQEVEIKNKKKIER